MIKLRDLIIEALQGDIGHYIIVGTIESHSFSRIEEVIGPHEGKELGLMLRGRKRLAILSREGIKKFYRYIAEGKFTYRIFRDNKVGQEVEIYFVTRVGDEKIIDIIEKVYKRAYSGGGFPQFSDRDHWIIGKLLGYSDKDIEDFLTNKKK